MPDSRLLVRQETAAPVETPGTTDMEEFEEALRRRTIHSYPRDPSYRLSGNLVPQPGDIAYCGVVKTTPAQPEVRRHPPTCSQCIRLRRIAKANRA